MGARVDQSLQNNIPIVETLPAEVKQQILLKADFKDIISLCSTCRAWALFRFDEYFWKILILRDFGKEALPRDKTLYSTAYKTHQCLVSFFLIGLKNSADFNTCPKFKEMFKDYHLPQAFRRALGISDIQEKIWTLRGIIQSSYMNNKKLHELEKLSVLIEDKSVRSLFLDDIVNAYLRQGKLRDLNKVYQLTHDPDLQDLAISHKVKANASFGNLGEAKRLAREIEGEVIKSDALMTIFQNYFDSEHLLASEETADLMERSFKSKAYKVIVDKYLQIGDLANAAKVAYKIPDDSLKSCFLSRIVNKLLHNRNFRDAETVSSWIPDMKLKALSLFEICKAYADGGNIDQAGRIANLMSPSDVKHAALIYVQNQGSYFQKFLKALRPLSSLRSQIITGISLIALFLSSYIFINSSIKGK